ncbi:hypothetical protein M6B38_395995 [Iris pallida]|uniref:Uncharacterized protein n=1 Tax=Iris pallida TaxID=29817 RepID=A0AAX6FWR0_IRIPA|nr:hypothetical protein M6B38_395995 [Iris pallida]
MSIFTHLNSRSSRPQFFLSPNFDRNPNPKSEVAMATPATIAFTGVHSASLPPR